MKMKFNHVGIIATEPKVGEMYNEGMKIHLTDFNHSEHRIEWIRPDADSGMPKEILTQTHIAYEVESLEEAIAGKKVILPPCDVDDTLRIAFIVDSEGCPIEYMQFTSKVCGNCGCGCGCK